MSEKFTDKQVNVGNLIAVAIFILGAFVSLIMYIATSKGEIADLKADVKALEKKVEKLYDYERGDAINIAKSK